MELMMVFRIHGFLRIELATFPGLFLQDFFVLFQCFVDFNLERVEEKVSEDSS